MKRSYSLSALAFAGLMTSAAACITPADIDYAAMSTSDLEDTCAAAMAQSQESKPYLETVVTPGEDGGADINASYEMQACAILQERRDAEGN